MRTIAIRLRVDVGTNAIRTVAAEDAPAGMATSLIGTDGVQIVTSNMTRTASGSQRSIVRFDVAIRNSLANVELVKPTFPIPPVGTQGLLLFPFDTKVVQGGSSAITPTSDWDGAPYNFFNDTHCGGSPTSDCFRWEEFAAPLAPGATSAAHTVGFEVSKDVQVFDVVMLVAADLHNIPVPPPILSLSKSSVAFNFTNGVVDPAVATVQVTNTGGGTLTGLALTMNPPPNWLWPTLSGTSAPALLTLTPTLMNVPDGSYSTTLTVSGDGGVTPQTVTVTMVVTGSPYASAIYVSQSDPNAADDATCGLGILGSGANNHPCKSITQGLNRAALVGRNEIRVADGHYTESITLANGRNLLGGFAPETWQRHLSSTNTIIDGVSTAPGTNHDRTVVATGITSATLFEGFVVRGPVNTKTGGNSYALYVANSGGLTIRNDVIYGGVGGPGNGGIDGTATSVPANGAVGLDAKVATGTGQCDASNNRFPTNGGSRSYAGDDVRGGNGGGNTCTPASDFTQFSALDGANGAAGDGAMGGSAGAGGKGGFDAVLQLDLNGNAVCLVSNDGSSPVRVGGDGARGGDGANGVGAAGGATQTGVANGQWFASVSASGTSGGNGGGGGGGGAGGGAHWITGQSARDVLGGEGGGGGSGGVGGAGGTGGSAGGAAFGIFIVGAAPTVTANTIVRGTGGNGGAGGAGASGKDGGIGAPGGQTSPLTAFCGEAGGRGGDGGRGGHGSGGAGGNGGASFGIFTSGVGTLNYCTSSAANTISGGQGGAAGAGGPSSGNPGGAGVAGTVAACEYR
ncbi:MAG TPA: hypothetical protein VJ867_02800 [Gemmatimonadaceae bacterium]|nr:hypothetical protein [Gemmatimonadaceae bacterium]